MLCSFGAGIACLGAPSFKARSRKSKQRMQSMNSSLFIPAGFSRGGKNIEEAAAATMNGTNAEFPSEFGRGANDPPPPFPRVRVTRVFAFEKKVGNAGSG